MKKKKHLLRGWTKLSEYENGEMVYPEIVRAEGFTLYGVDGKEYIDAKCQMKNVSFGYSVPEFSEAIMSQLKSLPFVPSIDSHTNRPAEEFAETLLSIFPDDYSSVYCTLSGTASCEAAIQIVRDYWAAQGKEKKVIVSLHGSYHGNSAMMAEVSDFSSVSVHYRLNDRVIYKKVIRPYCYRCSLGLEKTSCNQKCALELKKQLEQIDADQVAAFILEPIQGFGIVELPVEYVEVIKEFTLKNNILLIADEVLTGFARAGYNFAYQKYNLKPDVICLSKSLSNGYLPLGAIVFSDMITETMKDREVCIGSTQDGNPITVALGTAVVKHFKRFDWEGKVKALGRYFDSSLRSALKDNQIVGDIRGEGLFFCIELVEDRTRKLAYENMTQIHKAFIENGLFPYFEGNYIILAPPYIIENKEIDIIVERTIKALTV